MQSTDLKIGWRNLGRNRRRTAFALTAIAVGQFALLAMSGTMNGWKEEILAAITGPAVGDIQISAPTWRKKRGVDIVLTDLSSKTKLIAADELTASIYPRIYTAVLAAPAEQAHMAIMVGLDVEAESHQHGLLAGLRQKLGGRRVFVGRIAAERMNIKIGTELALVGQDADGALANMLYEVVAIDMTRLDVVNRQGVVMSLEDAQEFLALEDCAHQIIVRSKQSEGIDELSERLGNAESLKEEEVLTWKQIVPEAATMLGMIDYMRFIVLLFVFVAAITGIANTMLMSTYERVHEFGMLLALGATPRRIVRIVLAEAAALGLTGAAVGTGLGFLFVAIAGQTGLNFAKLGGETASDLAIEGMRIPMLVYPWLKVSDVLIGVVAVVVMSIAAAVYPAIVASRLEPMEALRD